MEQATYRFVAQHLNHCATAARHVCTYGTTKWAANIICKEVLYDLRLAWN